MTDEPGDALTPPTQSAGDYLQALVRGTLGAIPFAGGLAAETFGLLLVTPYQRRSREWMEQVAHDLRAFAERDRIDLEALAQNETFVSTLMQATQAAIRTSKQEKLRLLRNAVLSSSESAAVSADLQGIFVRYVDELTPAHFHLLVYLHANEERLRETQSYPDLLTDYLTTTKTKIPQDDFALALNDLNTRVLVHLSRGMEDFKDVDDPAIRMLASSEVRDKAMLRVTDIGCQFLHFVREHG
jgi:hypothetical protein